MRTMPHFRHLVDQVTDPRTALNLVAGNGQIYLTPTERRNTLLRTGRHLGFFARPGGTQDGQLLFGRRPGSAVPPTALWPRAENGKERSWIDGRLHRGDIRLAVGMTTAFDYATAQGSADFFNLVGLDGRPEIEAFAAEVLTDTLRAYDGTLHASESALVEGSLIVARILFEADDDLRRAVERWALRHRLQTLQFTTILDDARARGENPIARLTFGVEHRPDNANEALLSYAFARLASLFVWRTGKKPSDAADGSETGAAQARVKTLRWELPDIQPDDAYSVAAIIKTAVVRQTEFLLEHPETLALLCTVYQLTPQRLSPVEQREITATIRERLGEAILERLGQPGSSGIQALVGVLSDTGFWDGIEPSAIEDRLIDLLAAGGFNDVYGFLAATHGSRFPYARVELDRSDPENGEKRLAWLRETRTYLGTRLRRVYVRALQRGRLDVAYFVAGRCSKAFLDIPSGELCDLANLQHETGATDARIHEEEPPRMLFNDLLPAKR